MTHEDTELTETLLIEIATTCTHIDVAMAHIRHGQPNAAMRELQQALQTGHKCKLYAMAVRWMSTPKTFKRLIEEQLKWLEQRYANSS